MNLFIKQGITITTEDIKENLIKAGLSKTSIDLIMINLVYGVKYNNKENK